jgi:alpha-beta hydrolase superfamily lysophospholipase
MLYQQPATDRQRLLAVGHSEGGMYAILVAETVSPHPAGLALVEPQDERLLDLLTMQINESLDTRVPQGAITADTARRNAQLVR